MALKRILVVALAALSLGLPASPLALAQDGSRNSSPFPDHFPLSAEACFGRAYDAKHLKAHPKQRVTSFHILRDFVPDPNSEIDAETLEQMTQEDGSGGYVNVTAYVRFRDRKGVFSKGLSCGKSEGGKVRCGIECDGGSFNLSTSGSALLVDNEGFVVVGGCGASEEDQARRDFVAPGADDRTFRLDKLALAQCTALRDAAAPAWATLGKPLRLRFEAARATCHARTYDDAHLRAHPKQMVRRIAVLNPAKPQPHGDNLPNYDFIVRVEARDGRTLEARATCAPDHYAYNCYSPDAIADTQEFYLTRAGQDIMLRDRKGVLPDAMRAEFGTDDKAFKLQPAGEKDCTF